MFTGIIASMIVSFIIQIKQDRDQFERKRAVLFDAAFYLYLFEKEYRERLENNSEFEKDLEQVFELCREPAKYLSKIYESSWDVLDMRDIYLLRVINSEYKVIMKTCELINLHAKDETFMRDPEEIMYVWNEYDQTVTRLKEWLLLLYIKWKEDSVID